MKSFKNVPIRTALHGLRAMLPSLEEPLPAIHGLRGMLPSLEAKNPPGFPPGGVITMLPVAVP